MSWVVYALLSALFASLTAILAKIGIQGVDSNLATAIRTITILLLSWSLVFYQGTYTQLSSLSRFSILFLVLSGIATAISWLFYFKALQMGTASQVAPIDKLSLALTVLLAVFILHEKVTLTVVVGVGFMMIGAICISFG